MNIQIVAALLVLAPPAFSQHVVEFSAKAGTPISEAFDTSGYRFLGTGLHQGDSATRRYTAGVGLVLRLPLRFGAEVDVLYHRLGYDLNSSSPGNPFAFEHTWTTANEWEFPLLGVYRLPHFLHVAPRVLAGVSFRAVSGEATTGQCYAESISSIAYCPTLAPGPQQADSHLNARSSFGGTFGIGIEMGAGRIRLKPEIRYTRWRADADNPGGLFDLRSNPNQFGFLLGVGF